MSVRLVEVLLLAVVLAPFPCRSLESEPVHVESIMAQSIEMQKQYLAGTMLVRDSAVLGYVSAIARRLQLPRDRTDRPITVHIIKDHSFNAFATPHGAIYLCSGLLGRMENEAELAAIIGHEMTHIMSDHAVLSLMRMKQNAHTSTLTMIGLDFFIGGFSNAIAGTVFKVAITGYSRDLERQADSMGLVRMRAAGYPPLAFRNMFLKLKSYIVDEKVKEPFFFSTHPAVEERIRNYYQIAGSDTTAAGTGDYRQKEFITALSPVLVPAARVAFAQGHYRVAKNVATQCLALDTGSIDALLLLGDIGRFQPDSGARHKPEEWYGRALSYDPQNGTALRKMGTYLFSRGRQPEARSYLQRYLSVAGQSDDRTSIETYIRLCEEE